MSRTGRGASAKVVVAGRDGTQRGGGVVLNVECMRLATRTVSRRLAARCECVPRVLVAVALEFSVMALEWHF